MGPDDTLRARADSRERLLLTLDALLEHRHPDEVSLREVARHAGVSHGLPGYYFQDRRGLLTAYAAEGFRILAEMEQAAAARVADQPPAVQLAELGIAYVAFAERHRRRFAVMFQTHEVNLEDPEYMENSDRAFQALRDCVGAYFAGKPDSQERALSVIFSAWSLVHGAALLDRKSVV